MTSTDGVISKAAAARLWLLPLIAAICYPLFLRGCYGSMQLFAASQNSFDRFGFLVSFVISLAAAFTVPFTAVLCARCISEVPTPSLRTVRAYRIAHLAFAAPPLFTALGVITAILRLGELDFAIWLLLWLGLGLYCALAANRESPIHVRPPGHRLARFHGLLALTVLVIFLIGHLVNHLFGLWSPAMHGRVMHALEVIYRASAVEPLLVLCTLLLIGTGVTLAWRYTAIQVDGFRRAQTLAGMYLAAFILSHMTAVFVYARWLLHIPTDWAFASGAPTGLLRDAFNVRLIPHYAIAPWALVTHVGLGLRGVLRAHGVAERHANAWAKGLSGSGALMSILIILGLIGVHLGGS